MPFQLEINDWDNWRKTPCSEFYYFSKEEDIEPWKRNWLLKHVDGALPTMSTHELFWRLVDAGKYTLRIRELKYERDAATYRPPGNPPMGEATSVVGSAA